MYRFDFVPLRGKKTSRRNIKGEFIGDSIARLKQMAKTGVRGDIQEIEIRIYEAATIASYMEGVYDIKCVRDENEIPLLITMQAMVHKDINRDKVNVNVKSVEI